jgi:hypothetical protein
MDDDTKQTRAREGLRAAASIVEMNRTNNGTIYCMRPSNAPFGWGGCVMDSMYERRVWSGGGSS